MTGRIVSPRVAGIVLAAGESRRMGRPKALLPFKGRTFIENVITMLSEAGADPVITVLAPGAEEARAVAESSGARVVINPDFSEGQFSSLRRGVTELLSETVDAVVVALVDQPQIGPAVPRALIAEFARSAAPIVRPVWQGRGGHPLLFSSETFNSILDLPATATAYDVVTRFIARRRDVPSPDAAVVTDIDTPEDFERLGDAG